MSLPEHERRIIQYLLGRLSEEERFEMERLYFKDPASLEEMEAVELDLIERFLDGDLSPEDAKDFEARYGSSPALRAKLQTAEALRIQKSPALRGWRLALVAATGVLVVVTAWSLHRSWQLGQEKRALEEMLAQERQKPVPPPVIVATFALAPGSERALATRQTLDVPRDASVLRLKLAIDTTSRASSYHAILRTFEDRQVWDWGSVPVRREHSIELDLPAAQLEPDDYVLALQPASPDAPTHPSFVFRLSKEK